MRTLRGRGASVQQVGDLADPPGIEAEERVGAGPDRHGALRVVAQGEAWDAQIRRLRLDSTRVRPDGTRVGLQGEEVEVPDRIGEMDSLLFPTPAEVAEALPGPRMDWKDDG